MRVREENVLLLKQPIITQKGKTGLCTIMFFSLRFCFHVLSFLDPLFKKKADTKFSP